jgi:hypothetical protein
MNRGQTMESPSFIYFAWTPPGQDAPYALFKIYNDACRTSEEYMLGKGWVRENVPNDLFSKGELSSKDILNESQVAALIEFWEHER